MSKGLRALERIKEFMKVNCKHWKQDVGYIEEELKTLEIVKKFVWVENGEIHLGLYADSEIILNENDFETQEEYDLLKNNL